MSLSKPFGAKLWLGSLATPISPVLGNDSGPSTPIDPHPVNLIPTLDFTTWTQSGVYGMTEVKADTFTNQATAGIALNIGAVAGETYRVSFTMDRGPGALRVYLSEGGTITTNDDVHDVTPGETSIDVVASGPWFVFRASVGNTTTTVSNLEVRKKVVAPPLDLNQMISDIIADRFSNNEPGVLYVPAPVLLDYQVLYQDKEGSIPVEADGDPTGLMLDMRRSSEWDGAHLAGDPEFTLDRGDSPWTGSKVTNFNLVDGRAQVVSDEGGYDSINQAVSTTAGEFYCCTVRGEFPTGGDGKIRAMDGATELGRVDSISGVFEEQLIFQAGSGTTNIQFFVDTEESEVLLDYAALKAMPGNHAYQKNSAARPVYRTDGTLHWLEFDGADDHLLTTAPVVSVIPVSATVVGASGGAQEDRRLVGEGDTSDATLLYAVLQTGVGTPNQLTNFLRTSADGTLMAQKEGLVAFDNSTHVLEANMDLPSGNLEMRVDNEIDTRTFPTGSTIDADVMSIGALVRTTATSFWAGSVYAMCVSEGTRSPAVVEAVEKMSGVSI